MGGWNWKVWLPKVSWSYGRASHATQCDATSVWRLMRCACERRSLATDSCNDRLAPRDMAAGTFSLPAFSPLHSRHLHIHRGMAQPNEVASLLHDARTFSPYVTSASLIGSFLDHTATPPSGRNVSPLMRRTHKPSPLSQAHVEPGISGGLEDSLGPVNISLERTAMHQRLAGSPRPREATPPAAGHTTSMRVQLSQKQTGQSPTPTRARPRSQMMMSPMDIPTNAALVTRSANGT